MMTIFTLHLLILSQDHAAFLEDRLEISQYLKTFNMKHTEANFQVGIDIVHHTLHCEAEDGT